MKTYGHTWVVGTYGNLWEPYDESWQLFNGTAIAGPQTHNANPGSTAETWFTAILNLQPNGSWADYSYHWATSTTCNLVSPWIIGYTQSNPLAIQRPTITGVSAFWWLGAGVHSDGHSRSIYYAQALWTANANGATGTPTWSVNTVSGGGAVSLSCTSCASTTATSTAPSNGCTTDVTVYANYGGYISAPFAVKIVKPAKLILQVPYPRDATAVGGYNTTYQWTLQDSCNNQIGVLDTNEVFGTWTDDYYLSTTIHNNWGFPMATSAFIPTATCIDIIGAFSVTTPPSLVPQTPLTSVKVKNNQPWNFRVGSQTLGVVVPYATNIQQWYQNHGRHN